MTALELRIKTESEIEHVLNWSPLKLSLLYLALYNSGYRTDGLDFRIARLLQSGVKEETTPRC